MLMFTLQWILDADPWKPDLVVSSWGVHRGPVSPMCQSLCGCPQRRGLVARQRLRITHADWIYQAGVLFLSSLGKIWESWASASSSSLSYCDVQIRPDMEAFLKCPVNASCVASCVVWSLGQPAHGFLFSDTHAPSFYHAALPHLFLPRSI